MPEPPHVPATFGLLPMDATGPSLARRADPDWHDDTRCPVRGEVLVGPELEWPPPDPPPATVTYEVVTVRCIRQAGDRHRQHLTDHPDGAHVRWLDR
jgi:hypothetical protein